MAVAGLCYAFSFCYAIRAAATQFALTDFEHLGKMLPVGYHGNQERTASAIGIPCFQEIRFPDLSPLAAFPVPANNPKAMPLPRVVRLFPFGRYHRPITNLDDQIADREARFFGHAHEVAMRPLRPMAINHVRDFGKQ